jgi:integrase
MPSSLAHNSGCNGYSSHPGESDSAGTTVPRRARLPRRPTRFLGFTLHELRHSALQRIYRETGDLYAAKQLARHASVRTTEEYLHPTADDLRARMLESDSGGKRA